jgi:hypothetical protein
MMNIGEDRVGRVEGSNAVSGSSFSIIAVL